MISYFYIYLIVLVISLGTVSGSIYGMGKHDNDKNSASYISASVFFNISLITLLMSLVLIIKDSQTYKFCSINNLFKPAEIEGTLEDVAKQIVGKSQVQLNDLTNLKSNL